LNLTIVFNKDSDCSVEANEFIHHILFN